MNKDLCSWTFVGSIDDIPPRGARRVRTCDLTIAVFRIFDDRIFALEDRCPHQQGHLSQGIVHDGCVTCPLHNWVISLETGAVQGPDQGQVTIYPVHIKDRQIFLDLAYNNK